MTDWKEVENELKKFKEGEDYAAAENNSGTRIYTIKSREAKRKLRLIVFGHEGQLDGPITSKDENGNKITSWGGNCGVGQESEDKKIYYWYEEVNVNDGSESDTFKIVSGKDKIKQDEEWKHELRRI